MTIIDAHCHIYPDPISRKAVKAVDDFYDHLPTDHYDGTVHTLLSAGKACGVDHFVVHSVATKPEQVHTINQFIAQSMVDSNGAFIGLGTMHPASSQLREDFESILSLGLHGVKLHPDIQHFAADDDRAMQIYAMCESVHLPVLVHTGDHRYDYSNPERIVRILQAFPHLTFVGAHFGGWSVWDEAEKVLSPYPNIYVDCSSSFFWLKPEKAKDLIHAYGADRVMFGTDYPLWPIQNEIDALYRLGLSEEEYEMIFSLNAAKLYGIRISNTQGGT